MSSDESNAAASATASTVSTGAPESAGHASGCDRDRVAIAHGAVDLRAHRRGGHRRGASRDRHARDRGVVRDDDERAAVLGRQRREQIEHERGRLVVEVAGGFVGEHQARAGSPSARAIATRWLSPPLERGRTVPGPVGEPDRVEQLAGPAVRDARRAPRRTPTRARRSRARSAGSAGRSPGTRSRPWCAGSRRARCRSGPTRSTSPTRTVPACGRSRPPRIESNVVFPVPERPVIATNSPGVDSSSRSRRARRAGRPPARYWWRSPRDGDRDALGGFRAGRRTGACTYGHPSHGSGRFRGRIRDRRRFSGSRRPRDLATPGRG